MTTLTHDTRLRFEYQSGAQADGTWGHFQTVNHKHPRLIADVRRQLESGDHAEMAGGAGTRIRITPVPA